MRVELRDDGSYDVYVRQSWLGDAIRCPERGRQGIVLPEWSHVGNELTSIGTAVHAGVAAKLEGAVSPLGVAQESWREQVAAGIRWVKYEGEAKCLELIESCLATFNNEIYPQVTACHDVDKGIEQSFEFRLDTFELDGHEVRVWGKGTIDYATDGVCWDWKTASRKYNIKEYQQQSVQASMYAAACVAQGYVEYPVRFNFGVMIRGGAGQVVPTVRTKAHESQLREFIRPFAKLAIRDLGGPWPYNNQHYLCSEQWCSWWSICPGGGAVVSPAEQSVEIQFRGN